MAERFLDNYLGHLLSQANHAVYRDFDAHVRAAGLSPLEWRVLAALHDGEALTLGQLARAVLAKQPTATKLVQRMAEDGRVALRTDADDQRRTRVAITARGRRLVQPLVHVARQHETRLREVLGAGETRQLRRMLLLLVERPEP